MLRGGRVFSFAMTMVIVALLVFFSAQGALGPLQSVISLPLDFLQRVFGGTTRGASTFVEDVAQYRRLEQRNKDLEEAAAISQAELAQLRDVPAGTGGNFYLTQAARVSKRFARAVMVSTWEGQSSFTEAFRLLGCKKMATFREFGHNIGMTF